MKKLSILLLLITMKALGQPDGTFDPSFGTNGQVRTCTNNVNGNRVLIQNDDKIVIGGIAQGAPNIFLLARYNIDGTLDGSFGNSGIVTTSITGNSQILALALQPDNKIVAAGSANSANFALARYNPNGSLDTTFGTLGIVNDTAVSGKINDVAIQTDGKIVAVGSSLTQEFNGASIVRYNPNGTKDTTFGSAGTGIVNPDDDVPGAGTIGLNAVNIQNDGKIVVVGTIVDGGENRFFIARYLSTGVIDTSFSSDGFDIRDLGTDAFGRDVAVLYNNTILALARSTSGGNQDASLLLYNNDGTLNVAFGTNGISTFTMGSEFDEPQRLAIQTDSKIVVIAAPSSFRIARRLANGSADQSFGPNSSGLIIHMILDQTSNGSDIAINSKGDIIAAGTANNCIGLAQYEVNSLNYSTLSRALWQTYYNQNIIVKNS